MPSERTGRAVPPAGSSLHPGQSSHQGKGASGGERRELAPPVCSAQDIQLGLGTFNLTSSVDSEDSVKDLICKKMDEALAGLAQ